jgi:hypothetical protein
MTLRAVSLSVLLCLGCRAAPEPSKAQEAPLPSASAPVDPRAALDGLDARRPVPLLPMMAQHQKQNMREHLEAVQAIVAAAALGDFEAVASAGRRLGFSEATGHMCEHMGAAAPGFTEQALGFHHTADEIAVAAARRDSAAVLAALSKTLSACTTCHATYKQQLVASLPD